MVVVNHFILIMFSLYDNKFHFICCHHSHSFFLCQGILGCIILFYLGLFALVIVMNSFASLQLQHHGKYIHLLKRRVYLYFSFVIQTIMT